MATVHGNLATITRSQSAKKSLPINHQPEEELLTTTPQPSLTKADTSAARGLEVLPTTPPTNLGGSLRRIVMPDNSSSPLSPLRLTPSPGTPSPLPIEWEGTTPSSRASPPPHAAIPGLRASYSPDLLALLLDAAQPRLEDEALLLEGGWEEGASLQEQEVASMVEEEATPTTHSSSFLWPKETNEIDLSPTACDHPVGLWSPCPRCPVVTDHTTNTRAPASLVSGRSDPYRLLEEGILPSAAPLLAPRSARRPKDIIDIEEDDVSLPPPSSPPSHPPPPCTACTTKAERIEALEAEVARLKKVNTTSTLGQPAPLLEVPHSQPAGSSARVSVIKRTPQTTQPDILSSTQLICRKCGHRAQTKKDLMNHLRADHTMQCQQCKYMCSTMVKLDEHIAAKHTSTSQQTTNQPTPVHQPTKQKTTLYLSDSLVKSVDARRMERELGGRLASTDFTSESER